MYIFLFFSIKYIFFLKQLNNKKNNNNNNKYMTQVGFKPTSMCIINNIIDIKYFYYNNNDI